MQCCCSVLTWLGRKSCDLWPIGRSVLIWRSGRPKVIEIRKQKHGTYTLALKTGAPAVSQSNCRVPWSMYKAAIFCNASTGGLRDVSALPKRISKDEDFPKHSERTTFVTAWLKIDLEPWTPCSPPQKSPAVCSMGLFTPLPYPRRVPR